MGWTLGRVGWGSLASGDYFIEADPTNTYLTSETGLAQGVIWDDTTQTGGGAFVEYDPGISLTFVQVLQDVTFLNDGVAANGAYAEMRVSSGNIPVGMQIDLIFFADEFTEITRFTDTSTNPFAVNLSVFQDTDVDVPAGGLVRVEVTNTGSAVPTFSYGGELSLSWVQT